MYRFMELLLTQQAQSQEAIANAIRAALEASQDTESKKIATELKTVKEPKTFLQRVADKLKPVTDIGKGVSTIYGGLQFGKTVFDAVQPWLAENVDKIPEFIQSLSNLFP